MTYKTKIDISSLLRTKDFVGKSRHNCQEVAIKVKRETSYMCLVCEEKENKPILRRPVKQFLQRIIRGVQDKSGSQKEQKYMSTWYKSFGEREKRTSEKP
jgi:hypothetical protein